MLLGKFSVGANGQILVKIINPSGHTACRWIGITAIEHGFSRFHSVFHSNVAKNLSL